MRQKIHTGLLNSAKVAIVSPITEGISAEMLSVIFAEVYTDRFKLCPLVAERILHFECEQTQKCIHVRCYQFE